MKKGWGLGVGGWGLRVGLQMCLNEEGQPHLFDRRQVVASHVLD